MSYQGHVEKGMVVLDQPLPLPDGTPVLVEPIPIASGVFWQSFSLDELAQRQGVSTLRWADGGAQMHQFIGTPPSVRPEQAEMNRSSTMIFLCGVAHLEKPCRLSRITASLLDYWPAPATHSKEKLMHAYHDLGGLPAGPLDLSEHTYAPWEKRTHAMLVLLAEPRCGVMTVDELRRGIESLGAAEYDRLTYYDAGSPRWPTSSCKKAFSPSTSWGESWPRSSREGQPS